MIRQLYSLSLPGFGREFQAGTIEELVDLLIGSSAFRNTDSAIAAIGTMLPKDAQQEFIKVRNSEHVPTQLGDVLMTHRAQLIEHLKKHFSTSFRVEVTLDDVRSFIENVLNVAGET